MKFNIIEYLEDREEFLHDEAINTCNPLYKAECYAKLSEVTVLLTKLTSLEDFRPKDA